MEASVKTPDTRASAHSDSGTCVLSTTSDDLESRSLNRAVSDDRGHGKSGHNEDLSEACPAVSGPPGHTRVTGVSGPLKGGRPDTRRGGGPETVNVHGGSRDPNRGSWCT